MILGQAYIVYDGTELLEYAIKPIKNQIDYLCVLYQKTSWFGDKASDEDITTLHRLRDEGLIDDLILFNDFEPLNSYSNKNISTSKRFETKKRQVGLDYCRKFGCTHYLCSDVDEFYLPDQFSLAKDIIIQDRLSRTALKYWNYINKPIYKIDHIFGNVPFICRIGPKSKMGSHFFVPCDPTRGVSVRLKSPKNRLLDPDSIMMHHMETIRKDLSKKYKSTTRYNFKRDKTTDLISLISNVDDKTKNFNYDRIIFTNMMKKPVIKCDNIFNIPYETWEKE